MAYYSTRDEIGWTNLEKVYQLLGCLLVLQNL